MIQVWTVELDDARARRSLAEATRGLAMDERARADRFRFDRDRDRWLAGRIALRRLLASRLGIEPSVVEFRVDQHGKPHLAGAHAGRAEFNLSHAAGCALVAMTDDVPVGVDVELIQPLEDIRAVAETHFSREERTSLFALPESEWTAAFYRLWTRKEAYIKAVGSGLSHALDRFAVTQEPDACRFIHLDGDRNEAASWTLAHLAPQLANGPGEYVGALAVPAPNAAVDQRQFTWAE